MIELCPNEKKINLKIAIDLVAKVPVVTLTGTPSKVKISSTTVARFSIVLAQLVNSITVVEKS